MRPGRDAATLFHREPRLVALLVLVLVAAGASAFLALGRQEDPTITNLFATVTTVYPGADPARVESLVTDPVEEALQGVAEVALVTSESAAGVSIVQLELVETLDDDAIATAWADHPRGARRNARRAARGGARRRSSTTAPRARGAASARSCWRATGPGRALGPTSRSRPATRSCSPTSCGA